MKHRILFVCTGNICRSPMGEFILKDLVTKRGLADQFEIASAAVTTEEIGNPIYPPARQKLSQYGIGTPDNELGVGKKRARQLTRRDYETYDLLIGMDDWNMRGMRQIAGGDPYGKLHMMLDYTDRPGEAIDDPWYTRDFETAYREIREGCEGLLEAVSGKT